MFTKTDDELIKLGAQITTREIEQQPQLWQETLKIYQDKKGEIEDFLNKINEKFGKVKVIFTGAGTSAYVGNTVMPYLRKHADRTKYDFEAIDTTKIVSTPEDYLEADTPTVLLSFARSGNSPESVATVELAKQLVNNLYQIAITCAPEGHLAQDLEDDPTGLVLLMPAKSLDQGFAMTGSFSCMALMSLLVFDTLSDDKKANIIDEISSMGQSVIDRESEIQKLVDTDFDRITYIGSGALGGLAQEARLKILELTAGKVAALFDTSMGLRHGPKSFLDDKTIVFDFVSNNTYTRQYDLDILDEIRDDNIVPLVMGVGPKKSGQDYNGKFFAFESDELLPDAYLALPDIMFGQTIALLTSIKVGNTPDTPSPTGTVNRVVKGVTIHKFSK
ncbi:SIS domain-containing protein [Lactobacillus hominis]|uniref:Sugar isomerase protein AgaS n=1 Tax=Lactobacillus hominis DSM 23910 = CRBIP 24.179 TaxID=1423758 RepID=I7KHG3_9LACO|nr:SIS domain-containing protein [Lactobacillus hominis]KRM84566.1 sugar isomerase protein AgaS [Lactobacillus hominis DSM 23910 = CRBIP 24.179]MCT3348097.1 SIS domain-containing protein [Lactobacillus hominis]CCI82105.1 Sugar isomerase protein AgaS [Lactobacillus hominis DSM 23910 = CRBIP 24.179]